MPTAQIAITPKHTGNADRQTTRTIDSMCSPPWFSTGCSPTASLKHEPENASPALVAEDNPDLPVRSERLKGVYSLTRQPHPPLQGPLFERSGHEPQGKIGLIGRK
jgi:hypothetical protein